MTDTAVSTTRVMLGVGTVVTAGVLPVFLTGGLAVQLSGDLGLTTSGIGLAGSVFFAVSALVARPLAALTERIGPSAALRLAAAGSAGCLVLLAAVPSAIWLVVVLGLSGVPAALSQPAANEALMSTVEPARRGFGFAVKQSAIPVATLVAGLAVPAVALTLGWRWAYVVAAGLALAAIVVTPRVPWDRAARVERSAGNGGGLAPALLALALVAGLASAAANAMGTFVTISAVDVGYSESSAGVLLAVGSVAGLTSRLGAGWLADRHDLDLLRTVVAMMAVGAAGFALLGVTHQVTFLFGLVLGFGAGWAWPGIFNYAIASRYPDRVVVATSVTQTGVYVGASLGPVLFGLAADHLDPAVGWLVAAACLLVSSTVLAAIRAADRPVSASAAAAAQPTRTS